MAFRNVWRWWFVVALFAALTAAACGGGDDDPTDTKVTDTGTDGTSGDAADAGGDQTTQPDTTTTDNGTDVVCTALCDGKECGPDGCGGFLGVVDHTTAGDTELVVGCSQTGGIEEQLDRVVTEASHIRIARICLETRNQRFVAPRLEVEPLVVPGQLNGMSGASLSLQVSPASSETKARQSPTGSWEP